MSPPYYEPITYNNGLVCDDTKNNDVWNMCPGETARDCYTFGQEGCQAYGTKWGNGIDDTYDGDDSGLSNTNLRYSVCCRYTSKFSACNTPGDTSDDDDSAFGGQKDSRCCPSTECTKSYSSYTLPPSVAPTTAPSTSPTPLPTTAPTDSPTAPPTFPNGWPIYYSWGNDVDACPCSHDTAPQYVGGNLVESGEGCHDILTEADCLEAFQNIYPSLPLPVFHGHIDDPNIPRGCAWTQNAAFGDHGQSSFLINYHEIGSNNTDSFGHTVLCKNHDYEYPDDVYLPLFDPSSQWIEYTSNNCGPGHTNGFRESTGVCPDTVIDGVSYLNHKIQMLEVPATEGNATGLMEKVTMDGCEYYGWRIFHCVGSTDTRAPTTSSPTKAPTGAPTNPTAQPTMQPTVTIPEVDVITLNGGVCDQLLTKEQCYAVRGQSRADPNCPIGGLNTHACIGTDPWPWLDVTPPVADAPSGCVVQKSGDQQTYFWNEGTAVASGNGYFQVCIKSSPTVAPTAPTMPYVPSYMVARYSWVDAPTCAASCADGSDGVLEPDRTQCGDMPDFRRRLTRDVLGKRLSLKRQETASRDLMGGPTPRDTCSGPDGTGNSNVCASGTATTAGGVTFDWYETQDPIECPVPLDLAECTAVAALDLMGIGTGIADLTNSNAKTTYPSGCMLRNPSNALYNGYNSGYNCGFEKISDGSGWFPTTWSVFSCVCKGTPPPPPTPPPTEPGATCTNDLLDLTQADLYGCVYSVDYWTATNNLLAGTGQTLVPKADRTSRYCVTPNGVVTGNGGRNAGENLYVNSLTTADWSSGFPTWLTVDLGGVKTFCGIYINYGSGVYGLDALTIEYSAYDYDIDYTIDVTQASNGVTWSTAYDGAIDTSSSGSDVLISTTSASARYVRLKLVCDACLHGVRVYDLQVRCDCPTLAPTPPTLSPTTGAPTAPTVAPTTVAQHVAQSWSGYYTPKNEDWEDVRDVNALDGGDSYVIVYNSAYAYQDYLNEGFVPLTEEECIGATSTLNGVEGCAHVFDPAFQGWTTKWGNNGANQIDHDTLPCGCSGYIGAGNCQLNYNVANKATSNCDTTAIGVYGAIFWHPVEGKMLGTANPTTSPTAAPSTKSPTAFPTEPPTDNPTTPPPTTAAPTILTSCEPLLFRTCKSLDSAVLLGTFTLLQCQTECDTYGRPGCCSFRLTDEPSAGYGECKFVVDTRVNTHGRDWAASSLYEPFPVTSYFGAICGSPTASPTTAPSASPTTASPTTTQPTKVPTAFPSRAPSPAPSSTPTDAPTTTQPSRAPSAFPTRQPTGSPSVYPSRAPTDAPTTYPSAAPSAQPSASPTPSPTLPALVVVEYTSTVAQDNTTVPKNVQGIVDANDPRCVQDGFVCRDANGDVCCGSTGSRRRLQTNTNVTFVFTPPPELDMADVLALVDDVEVNAFAYTLKAEASVIDAVFDVIADAGIQIEVEQVQIEVPPDAVVAGDNTVVNDALNTVSGSLAVVSSTSVETIPLSTVDTSGSVVGESIEFKDPAVWARYDWNGTAYDSRWYTCSELMVIFHLHCEGLGFGPNEHVKDNEHTFVNHFPALDLTSPSCNEVTCNPTSAPSANPTDAPTTVQPSAQPTTLPSEAPSPEPTPQPSDSPSPNPTLQPTPQPTRFPTTASPTYAEACCRCLVPKTNAPTPAPSKSPTVPPTVLTVGLMKSNVRSAVATDVGAARNNAAAAAQRAQSFLTSKKQRRNYLSLPRVEAQEDAATVTLELDDAFAQLDYLRRSGVSKADRGDVAMEMVKEVLKDDRTGRTKIKMDPLGITKRFNNFDEEVFDVTPIDNDAVSPVTARLGDILYCPAGTCYFEMPEAPGDVWTQTVVDLTDTECSVEFCMGTDCCTLTEVSTTCHFPEERGLRFNLWFCGSGGAGPEDGSETEAPSPAPTPDPLGQYKAEDDRIELTGKAWLLHNTLTCEQHGCTSMSGAQGYGSSTTCESFAGSVIPGFGGDLDFSALTFNAISGTTNDYPEGCFVSGNYLAFNNVGEGNLCTATNQCLCLCTLPTASPTASPTVEAVQLDCHDMPQENPQGDTTGALVNFGIVDYNATTQSLYMQPWINWESNRLFHNDVSFPYTDPSISGWLTLLPLHDVPTPHLVDTPNCRFRLLSGGLMDLRHVYTECFNATRVEEEKTSYLFWSVATLCYTEMDVATCTQSQTYGGAGNGTWQSDAYTRPADWKNAFTVYTTDHLSQCRRRWQYTNMTVSRGGDVVILPQVTITSNLALEQGDDVVVQSDVQWQKYQDAENRQILETDYLFTINGEAPVEELLFGTTYTFAWVMDPSIVFGDVPLKDLVALQYDQVALLYTWSRRNAATGAWTPIEATRYHIDATAPGTYGPATITTANTLRTELSANQYNYTVTDFVLDTRMDEVSGLYIEDDVRLTVEITWSTANRRRRLQARQLSTATTAVSTITFRVITPDADDNYHYDGDYDDDDNDEVHDVVFISAAVVVIVLCIGIVSWRMGLSKRISYHRI